MLFIFLELVLVHLQTLEFFFDAVQGTDDFLFNRPALIKQRHHNLLALVKDLGPDNFAQDVQEACFWKIRQLFDAVLQAEVEGVRRLDSTDLKAAVVVQTANKLVIE